MLSREEFIKEIEKAADDYARGCVMDADEHEDAVDAIASDFIEGAMKAYELLRGRTGI